VTGWTPVPYGKVLGVVSLNGTNVNLEMIKASLAEVYRGDPLRRLNMSPFNEAEKHAREAKKGMWRQGDKYVRPKDWREMRQDK
jgi:micrococcal nuclease